MLCLADARPADGYRAILAAAGLTVVDCRDESWALRDIVSRVAGGLMLAEAACRGRSLVHLLPEIGWDFDEARAMLRRTKEFVDAGGAGYVLLTARAAA